MDKLTAAKLVGVAEYTVAEHTFDHDRDGWVVKVRDMANHTVVERFVPADNVAHIYPRPAAPPPVEERESSHGEALLELAEAARVPAGTVQEVIDWVGTYRTRAAAALAAEQAKDKPRKTLVDVLQAHLELAELADEIEADEQQ